MKVDRALVIWLNHTSADVLVGLKGGGGQPGVFFGKNGALVRRFFRGTRVRQETRRWTFGVEPFLKLPSWQMTIVEQKGASVRSRECYLTGSTPTSPSSYPLWRNVVIPIPKDSNPRQAIVFLLDSKKKFHARVIDERAMAKFPSAARKLLGAARMSRSKVVLLEAGFSSYQAKFARGSQRRIQNPWSRVAHQALKIRGRKPGRSWGGYRRYLRDRVMRNAFLAAIGSRCQVLGCTTNRPAFRRYRTMVVEVHHLMQWSETRDDSPYNLSVVCANHHSILTHFGNRGSRLRFHEGSGNVTVRSRGFELTIVRDLERYEVELGRAIRQRRRRAVRKGKKGE